MATDVATEETRLVGDAEEPASVELEEVTKEDKTVHCRVNVFGILLSIVAVGLIMYYTPGGFTQFRVDSGVWLFIYIVVLHVWREVQLTLRAYVLFIGAIVGSIIGSIMVLVCLAICGLNNNNNGGEDGEEGEGGNSTVLPVNLTISESQYYTSDGERTAQEYDRSQANEEWSQRVVDYLFTLKPPGPGMGVLLVTFALPLVWAAEATKGDGWAARVVEGGIGAGFVAVLLDRFAAGDVSLLVHKVISVSVLLCIIVGTLGGTHSWGQDTLPLVAWAVVLVGWGGRYAVEADRRAPHMCRFQRDTDQGFHEGLWLLVLCAGVHTLHASSMRITVDLKGGAKDNVTLGIGLWAGIALLAIAVLSIIGAPNNPYLLLSPVYAVVAVSCDEWAWDTTGLALLGLVLGRGLLYFGEMGRGERHNACRTDRLVWLAALLLALRIHGVK
eukprot:Hpha_TRINITY_DN19085_c0_g1::TRINITY_DN19085_c0_g1_i1::g.138377::m.138377